VTAVGVLGPGRAGLGLGLALARAGYSVAAHGRTPKPVPPPIEATSGGTPPWLSRVEVILVAVPDDAIAGVAAQLARTSAVGQGHTVLHLSGALDRTALDALESSGAALGSLHPLQTLADPASAPERLRGAVAVTEGDARAVRVARELAGAVGLHAVEIPSGSKAAYHAAGVFGSNYLVALLSVARRLLEGAGLPPELAWPGLLRLVRGTVDNLAAEGLEGALTGPVARGDTETIKRHVSALTGEDAELYRLLGRAAADLAALDAKRRTAVKTALNPRKREK
jgi:predicted short-subunit dehydrogenase-like oxidoreductase (DUF2520 family)